MTTTSLTRWPRFSVPQSFNTSFVGFDDLFDHLNAMAQQFDSRTSYPPHNVRRVSDIEYEIELAVAGFAPEELQVHIERGVLTVRGTHDPTHGDASAYLHKGVSTKDFVKQLALADNVEVDDAQLEHGMLRIRLRQVIPDHLKRRDIPIQTHGRSVPTLTA